MYIVCTVCQSQLLEHVVGHQDDGVIAGVILSALEHLHHVLLVSLVEYVQCHSVLIFPGFVHNTKNMFKQAFEFMWTFTLVIGISFESMKRQINIWTVRLKVLNHSKFGLAYCGISSTLPLSPSV